MGAIEYSNEAVRAKLDAITALLDGGDIQIYEGTKPTDADTAIGAQTLLVTLGFNADSFGAASDDNPGGVAAANAITTGTAVATGTAQFARLRKSDGTVVAQGTVTVTSGGGLIELSSTSIATGIDVDLTGFNLREPESA